jgi:lipoprotein signal peptidase
VEPDCGGKDARLGAGALVAFVVFLVAVTADLATKVVAVDWGRTHEGVYYNAHAGDLGRRLCMCAAAVGVTYALAYVARWRGLGAVWGSWAGVGLLVAGVIGNGVSPLLWSLGVPDFIDMPGGWVWNVADFQITFGLLAVPMSLAAIAGLSWWRDSRADGAASTTA